jgi:hypothetical protein
MWRRQRSSPLARVASGRPCTAENRAFAYSTSTNASGRDAKPSTPASTLLTEVGDHVEPRAVLQVEIEHDHLGTDRTSAIERLAHARRRGGDFESAGASRLRRTPLRTIW